MGARGRLGLSRLLVYPVCSPLDGRPLPPHRAASGLAGSCAHAHSAADYQGRTRLPGGAITVPDPESVLQLRAHSRDRARGAPGCTRASLSDEGPVPNRRSTPKDAGDELANKLELGVGKSPAVAQRHTDTSGSQTLSITLAESRLAIRRERSAAFTGSRARLATFGGSRALRHGVAKDG